MKKNVVVFGCGSKKCCFIYIVYVIGSGWYWLVAAGSSSSSCCGGHGYVSQLVIGSLVAVVAVSVKQSIIQ